MNPFLAPLELFVRWLNALPGVTATVRTEYVEVEDRTDAGGRRVLLVRNDRDPAALRRAVEAAREGGDGRPAPLVRFDCAPEGDAATVVTDDPDAAVELGHYAVTVEAAGVTREFDLPFDPSSSARRVSNGVLTVDIE